MYFPLVPGLTAAKWASPKMAGEGATQCNTSCTAEAVPSHEALRAMGSAEDEYGCLYSRNSRCATPDCKQMKFAVGG